jgi:ESS family glutamate:Na+ symporter
MVYIVLRNFVGIGVATAFGMDRLIGMMSDSISLTGGVGTSVAWTPVFDDIGINGAPEIGIASNTIGLIAACVIGGPVARYLINRDKLVTGSHDAKGPAFRLFYHLCRLPLYGQRL